VGVAILAVTWWRGKKWESWSCQQVQQNQFCPGQERMMQRSTHESALLFQFLLQLLVLRRMLGCYPEADVAGT